MNNELRADIPAESLVLGGGAPVYERAYTEPKYFKDIAAFDLNSIADCSLEEAKDIAKWIVAQPNIASKKWVYNQYDSMVGTINQSTNKASDAAVVKVKGTDKSIAMTVDCNSRFVYADPYKGGMMAVAEAARNLVCTGAEPAAITNCLNFGNPYNPEVYYQFVYAIKGMGDACRKFDTPVTGGNVSFYNQSSDENAVFPTPSIGMVGLIPSGKKQMSLDFKNEGDLIYVLGEQHNDISSSQYLVHYKNTKQSPAPFFDLDQEYAIQKSLLEAISLHLIESAHDTSEGGLFVALFESAKPNQLGFHIKQNNTLRTDAFLFGETQSRIVVSITPLKKQAFENLLKQHAITFDHIGQVSNGSISINDEDFGNTRAYDDLYENSLGQLLES
jgi:phosphoribosylformylglycinamidine synthase